MIRRSFAKVEFNPTKLFIFFANTLFFSFPFFFSFSLPFSFHIQIFIFPLSFSSLHMSSFTSSRCMMCCCDEYECQYSVLSLQFYSSDSFIPLTSSSVLYSLFSLPDTLLFLHLIPSLSSSSVHHTTNILFLSFISSTHTVCVLYLHCMLIHSTGALRAPVLM